MAYKWEGHDILAPLTFRSNQTVWTVEKLDKSIERVAHPSQRWELSFQIIADESENTFFNAMTSEFMNKKTMTMPSLVHNMSETAKPNATQLTASSSALSNSPSVQVGNSGARVVLRKGTFIQFSNHDKVYAVTGKTTVNASATDVTLQLFPRLRKEVPSGTTIKAYDDVVLHYYLDTDMVQGITYNDGILSSIDRVSVLEAV